MMAVKTRSMWAGRWFIAVVLAGAAFLGVGLSGCNEYWAGPVPLGADNDVRTTSSLAAGTWAQPIEAPGLPNLHKVSDTLYRGAQPTDEGIRQLKKLGIRTVVDLRDSGAADNMGGTGMTYVRIPSTAWQPEEKDVVQFLQVVNDPSLAPIFVHCHRGADRTGMMTAIYRVAVQGWTKDQAIEEMTRGGFGFYSGWQNIVRYVRDLDIEHVKQLAASGANGPAHD